MDHRGKRADVDEWLGRHPEVGKWVALDDEAAAEGLPDLGINAWDGFTVRPYRMALRLLTGRGDLGFGTSVPAEADALLRQHGLGPGDYEFAWWLEMSRPDGWRSTPAELLRYRYGYPEPGAEAEFLRRLQAWLESRDSS